MRVVSCGSAAASVQRCPQCRSRIAVSTLPGDRNGTLIVTIAPKR
jgi:hypothetical protein